MTPVRNQPILFLNTDAPTGISPDRVYEVPTVSGCCPPEFWVQSIAQTDTITFQFDAPACENRVVQIIDNFDFTDPDTNSSSQADWSGSVDAFNIGGSGARFDADGDYLIQTNAGIVEGTWYKLEISINVISATESKPSNIIVTGFNQQITVPAADGLYEFYVQANSGTYIRLTHEEIAPDDNFLFVRWCALYEISEPEVTILNTDGTQLSTTESSLIRNGRTLSITSYVDAAVQAAGNIRIGVYRLCDGDAWISEVICIEEDVSCTIQIGGCGNSNFQFGQLSTRLKGFIAQDQASEFDRFITQDSKGRYRNNYTKMNRLWTLYIEQIPAHVRDWINWLTGYNTIAIREPGKQSQEFFVLNEPEAPNFADRMYGLGKMRVTLVPKEELNESIYEGDCSIVLPPVALGKRNNANGGGVAIESGTDQGINAE